MGFGRNTKNVRSKQEKICEFYLYVPNLPYFGPNWTPGPDQLSGSPSSPAAFTKNTKILRGTIDKNNNCVYNAPVKDICAIPKQYDELNPDLAGCMSYTFGAVATGNSDKDRLLQLSIFNDEFLVNEGNSDTNWEGCAIENPTQAPSTECINNKQGDKLSCFGGPLPPESGSPNMEIDIKGTSNDGNATITIRCPGVFSTRK